MSISTKSGDDKGARMTQSVRYRSMLYIQVQDVLRCIFKINGMGKERKLYSATRVSSGEIQTVKER